MEALIDDAFMYTRNFVNMLILTPAYNKVKIKANIVAWKRLYHEHV